MFRVSSSHTSGVRACVCFPQPLQQTTPELSGFKQHGFTTSQFRSLDPVWRHRNQQW